MTTIERRLTKNIPSFDSRTSEENDPSFTTEDEEVDETFVALQKMLKTLNRSNRTRHNSSNSSNGSFLSNSSNTQVIPANDSTNQQRMTREEMLESRRQERDRFRRSLFATNNKNNVHNSRRRRTCPGYYCSEEEEEDEAPEPSVESTISNRFMNGSFSNLNVHIISRSRWTTEDRVMERLPIVMLSKDGKVSIPTDNKKINVVQTDEYIDLRDKLIENLPPGAASMHYLTPPRSTWYMQMHDFEELKW
ncbi:hypothetical protein KXD40_001971 [Peronospora effusa]|uniref:Uncharacterized protein n=2 Tax=Peronospora TaxID=70742 RepID=A0A3M6VIX4_9STRA|nr:hypothetical protein DD238_002010 [Peronospora effusa]CAH0489385.1 unnamed protein product [Peronospora farinosa]RQM16298.1 hypothetical protein DD237_002829 [Peronospora effusa]UIZ26626.1 hypothetical protein KXD40_001971 [Peronospora effusa]CAI5726123.1 unnamed protein product [Peronospora effusa]